MICQKLLSGTCHITLSFRHFFCYFPSLVARYRQFKKMQKISVARPYLDRFNGDRATFGFEEENLFPQKAHFSALFKT
jgi:hypothetical protein